MKKVLCKCLKCGKEFLIFQCWYRGGNGKYCSKSCANEAAKEKEHINYHVKMICQECGKEYFIKRYRKNISKYCSSLCKRKNMPSGSDHSNWKGGISKRDFRSRKWRKEVLTRDGVKCVECGNNKKDDLTAHHIKEYANFPELRFDINNGKTLCIECHSTKHKKEKNFILKGKVKSGNYKKCEICGRDFYVTPYKISSTKFCSRECMYKSFNTGKYISCKTCNKEFYVTPVQVNRGRSWCSWECYNKGRSIRNGKKEKEMDTKNWYEGRIINSSSEKKRHEH